MIDSQLSRKILKRVIKLEKFGMNDLTWEKEFAIELINDLFQDEIGILGGSVYKISTDRLIPMYDNWYCNPNEGETRDGYFLRSKKMALDYIKKYPVYPDEKIVFSLVFNEQSSICEKLEEQKELIDLEFPDPSIKELAQVGDSEWLICPNCIDAWLWPNDKDALVRCPKCEKVFNNPRYKEFHGFSEKW